MKKKIEVYQEHGSALCLQDGVFIITFFPEQLSFVKREKGYTMQIRPSVVETEIDEVEFVRLKTFSEKPTTEWLHEKISSALYDFSNFEGDIQQKEILLKNLRKEINTQLKALKG